KQLITFKNRKKFTEEFW
ncbi:conserved hypothetical protein, partial [Trichinella spiralis]